MQHDPIYERAPRVWEEGIPLGNGDMGAVIWRDGAPLRITLDKYDVWELRTQEPTDPRYNHKLTRPSFADSVPKEKSCQTSSCAAVLPFLSSSCSC